jgi:hypothetical protein
MKHAFLPLAFVSLFSLGACQAIDAQVGADLTGVAAVAKSAGDKGLAACVAKVKPVLAAAVAVKGPAVLSKAAMLYEIRKIFAAEGACQGVTAEVATQVFITSALVLPHP